VRLTPFILLTAMIGLALYGCAGTPTGPGKPEFDFTEFDFGRIPQGVVVTHIYKLANVGGDSVVVQGVRTHCGCTKAPLEIKVAHVGETIPIELRFSSRGYRGKSKKSATVNMWIAEENTPSERLSFSTYTDTVANPFSYGELGAEPFKIEFADSVETIEITLTNRIAAKREVEIVDFQSDRIKLSWDKKTIGPKGRAVLKVTRLIPAHGLVASITLEMPGHENTRITIPIEEYVEVGTTRTGRSVSRRVTPTQAPTEPWTNPRK